jgi:excisionase family DNA binding protein
MCGVNERLLTTREVAAFLGMSPESVLRRYRRGELPGYRLSSNVLRFRASELEAWLEGRRESGSEYSPLVSIREEV